MVSPLRVRKILSNSWATEQVLLTSGSQHSSCLNRQIDSWILHKAFKIIYILSHLRLRHFPDGSYSNGLPEIAVWKSLWSFNLQRASRAEEQTQLAGPPGPDSLLWEVVWHSALLNCAHKGEGGRAVCCWTLSTGKIGRLETNCTFWSI